MAKLKRNLKKRDIGFIIGVLLITIVSLTIYAKVAQSVKPNSNNGQVTQAKQEGQNEENKVVVPKTQEELIKYLSTLGERDRMEYYCGEYFKHLDKKEYESAYNLLYPEFKENYFPTLEKFVEYVQNTYPSEWGLSYDDITRQGDIYVLKLRIFDVLGSKENEKFQRIVLRENNYNNYYISFQVI